jgi:hypothetical protein
MRRTELTLTRLKQHDSTPARYLQITRDCASSEMRDDAFNSLAIRSLCVLIMNPDGADFVPSPRSPRSLFKQRSVRVWLSRRAAAGSPFPSNLGSNLGGKARAL